MADNDKAVLIGYVLIDQLQDNGTEGIVESGKNLRHLNNGTSSYEAKSGCVIVGRKHSGDENGYTYYLTGKPKVIVAPHAGAWIEIEMVRLAEGLGYVAPHAGAWIEIRLTSRNTFT